MVTMFLNRREVALATRITILLACVLSYGWQQQGGNTVHAGSARNGAEFQAAANDWMKVPVDVRTQMDTVPPENRQARDAHWDHLIGASRPLADPNAQGHPMPVGDAVLSGPEFGDLGAGVLVVGKFESYRTILSASQRSVYAEIQLRIQHVFGHPDAPIREGDLLDLDRPGGTIIAPWGKTISYGIHAEQMGLQPQHTYLIRLGYNPSGNFYTGGYKTGELWDLTDGTVKPGNSLQKARADHGMSEINGRSIDTLIQFLDKKYQEYYQGGH